MTGGVAGWKVQRVLGDLVLERCDDEFKRAWLVLSYIGAWGLFYENNGRGPNTDREFSAGVNVPLGTSHRWRTAFEQTFPAFDTPEVLWHEVKTGVSSQSVEVAGLQVGAARVQFGAG